LPPKGDWFIWLILAGRGWGKTKTGSEFIRKRVCEENAREIIIGAKTPTELREYCIEGKSGILSVFPPHQKPVYIESKSRVEFHTGAIAHCYSSETPDKFRGGNPDTAWFDELSTYKRLQEMWDAFIFSIREGDTPRIAISTTPRPIKLLKEIMEDKDTYVTSGSTYDNAANLSKIFMDKVIDKYAGTRLGRQEIYAELLEDVEGALWTAATLEKNRVQCEDIVEFSKKLKTIKIGVDPAASSNDSSAETGIIVGGLDQDNHGYRLADGSLIGTPNERANVIRHLFYKFQCNEVIAEKNNGGDMVEHMIKTVDKDIPVKMVWASRAKFTRAEPVAALDEQGKISTVNHLPKLEDEQTSWTPKSGKSPNRIDADVWLWSDLLLESDNYDMEALGAE
jgi:phage terminase large subunit-like protein